MLCYGMVAEGGRLRVLALVAFVFLVCLAVPGTYIKKPTLPNNPYGGMIYWGPGLFSAYGSNSAGYGAEQFDDDYVNANGTITTVYVWQRAQIPDPQNPLQFIDDPLDNPPEFVISKEFCRAYAYASSVGVMLVAADNGLGFEGEEGEDEIGIFVESMGTLYTKRAGGQEITLTCSPSATATVSNPGPPYTGAYVYLRYTSQILVPKVDLVGTTRFYSPHLNAFLTGQRITGSVSGYGPLQIATSGYSWSVESTDGLGEFKSYTHTNSLGKRYTHTALDIKQPMHSFYTVKAGTATVECDLTFTTAPQGSRYEGGLPAFTAKSLPIDSVRPNLKAGSVVSGTVALDHPTVPTKFTFAPTPPAQVGQRWSGVTYDIPAPFPQVGKGCFAQLISANRHIHRYVPLNNPPYKTHYAYIRTGAIDTGFPYEPPPLRIPFEWDLPGTLDFVDSPDQPLSLQLSDGGGNNWHLSTAEDSFACWAMFKPPSKDNQPTEWIPMARYTWSWHGTADKQSGQWDLDPKDGQVDTTPVEYFDHPEWNTFSPSPLTPWIAQ
jgi:hypothetical protein